MIMLSIGSIRKTSEPSDVVLSKSALNIIIHYITYIFTLLIVPGYEFLFFSFFSFFFSGE